MRPETRLESVVFQLTPTRTRCDLVVVANGRKEKIASGFLNPFAAHLKVAQEQIAKGGYSITLEPDPVVDAPWFTRGTVERFVRFVSTPDVLERVTTIESEILQIVDAIAVQSDDTLGLRSVEGHNGKLVACMEGSKTGYGPDADNALVLYKPDTQPTPPMQNHSAMLENSKSQLLRVLETRKTVLRKEQAMAFARAVAAGFDIDNLLYLTIFAEHFGASRLMKACTQFIELWKQKHETGQWIEIDEIEPEAMSARSEFPPFNPAGILFMGDNMKHNMETISVSNGDVDSEDASKAGQRTPQHSGPTHEYFRGPYQSAYPPWAIHPPYSMQCMPCNPGMNPYYPPPYAPTDDTMYHHSERRSRRNTSESNDSEKLDEESDQSSSEETSHGHRSHKKSKKRGKKNPSVVVIRNVNVTSKKHVTPVRDSQTGSDIASEDSDDSHTESRKKNNKRSTSKKKEAIQICNESADEYNDDEMSYGQDGDQGNWNAFQNVLLRADEKTKGNHADLFSSEKVPHPARKMESRSIDDPILLVERDPVDTNEQSTIGLNSTNGRIRPRQMLSGDDLMMSGEGRSFSVGDIKEIEAGGGGYKRGTTDEFMIYGQEKPMDRESSLDPFAEAQYKSSNEVEKSVHCVPDESFIMPLRSTSEEMFGLENRTAIDIDVELPLSVDKISDSRVRDQLFYEPDELMPERGYEEVSLGYDPAMDYDSHMQIPPGRMVEDTHVQDASLNVEVVVKKPEKDKRLRSSQESLDKRRKDASARRLSSSRGTLTDAQKRAQNLRAYKADLQKAKKEQEDEQIKRLEKLKLERQKRISARSNASNATATPQQPKVKPSSKLSPSGYKSSKFSDSAPASSSPIRKLPAKTTPGTDPSKASKLNDYMGAVSKSTSSMAEMKKEKNRRTESTNERLKELAEPKTNSLMDHTLSSKSAKMDHLRRSSTPQDTQIRKISAMMQLDQSKSATLPELKVKSPRAPAVVMKNVVAAKEKKEGSPAAKASPTQEIVYENKNNGDITRRNSYDDGLVIEKSVVMLENEVVSTPPVILHSERIADKETACNDRIEKPSPELEYTAIRPQPSPDSEDLVIGGPDDQGSSYEVVTERQKDENHGVMEKPYQAPFARVTSLENASANSPADSQPVPMQEPESLLHSESIKARVPESLCPPVSHDVNEKPRPESLLHSESIIARVPESLYPAPVSHDVNEKPRSKELRGLRKLLKFGRKGHSAALTDGAMGSDASSVDEATAGNGSMLKNLISQDDSSTSSKASRSSLLSPFRRKQKVIVL